MSTVSPKLPVIVVVQSEDDDVDVVVVTLVAPSNPTMSWQKV
jgi:hypothetical protein